MVAWSSKTARSLILALGLILSLLLTACGDTAAGGGGEENEGTPDAEATEPSNGGATDASTDEAAEDVDAIVWDWDHSVALPGFFDDMLRDELPRMMEEGTDGRLELNVLYGVGNPLEALERMREGRVDGGTIIPEFYSGTYPSWGVFGLPLFPDREALRSGVDTLKDDITADINDETQLTAVSGLLPWGEVAIFSEDPLPTIDAFNGQRLRSAGQVAARFIETMGAAPVTMGAGDMYSALERGAIDGALGGPMAFVGLNLWEVVGYYDVWPSGNSVHIPVVNNESLEELPEDLRDQVLQVFSDFEELWWDTVPSTEELRQPYLDNGMELVEPSEEELQKFDEDVRPEIIDWWLDLAGDKGQQLLDQLQ